MLCPDISDFPPPKVMITNKENQNLESVLRTVNMNYFYRNFIITCPDETQLPTIIQDIITDDSDYYKITNCSLKELVEPIFVESFVKSGSLYCLSTNRNCIVDNCVAITPDGVLTLHILDYIYQTLGLEGIKRPHNYYEIKVDLKNIRNHEKVRTELSKLELFDFDLIWEPNAEDICPSSIAKYFSDKSIAVSVHSLTLESLLPTISEVPSLTDVDIEEMVEWVGLLSLDIDITPTDMYISTYSQPDSEHSLKTTRISVSNIMGFIPPSLATKICEKLSEYVTSRELENYWVSISIQSDENSLFKWNKSSPRMFQAQESSCNVFFTHNGHVLYSIGHLKYS